MFICCAGAVASVVQNGNFFRVGTSFARRAVFVSAPVLQDVGGSREGDLSLVVYLEHAGGAFAV